MHELTHVPSVAKEAGFPEGTWYAISLILEVSEFTELT
jgi:hypothetical protein